MHELGAICHAPDYPEILVALEDLKKEYPDYANAPAWDNNIEWHNPDCLTPTARKLMPTGDVLQPSKWPRL
jgi:hypothetical protein